MPSDSSKNRNNIYRPAFHRIDGHPIDECVLDQPWQPRSVYNSPLRRSASLDCAKISSRSIEVKPLCSAQISAALTHFFSRFSRSRAVLIRSLTTSLFEVYSSLSSCDFSHLSSGLEMVMLCLATGTLLKDCRKYTSMAHQFFGSDCLIRHRVDALCRARGSLRSMLPRGFDSPLNLLVHHAVGLCVHGVRLRLGEEVQAGQQHRQLIHQTRLGSSLGGDVTR